MLCKLPASTCRARLGPKSFTLRRCCRSGGVNCPAYSAAKGAGQPDPRAATSGRRGAVNVNGIAPGSHRDRKHRRFAAKRRDVSGNIPSVFRLVAGAPADLAGAAVFLAHLLATTWQRTYPHGRRRYGWDVRSTAQQSGSKREETLVASSEARWCPWCGAGSDELAIAAVEAILEGGISPSNHAHGAGARRVIEGLVKRFGERALIGAGTVLTASKPRGIEAGAQFVVSQGFDAATVELVLSPWACRACRRAHPHRGDHGLEGRPSTWVRSSPARP